MTAPLTVPFPPWLRQLCGWGWTVYVDVTSPLRGSSGKYSMTRIVVAFFAWRFGEHWPRAWGPGEVQALAILVFAIPLDALLARVPVSEALGAVQAAFSMLASRASAAATEYVSRVRDLRDRTSTADPAPPVTPPAHEEEEDHGDPR